jgi:hypothetical protein
MNMDEYREAMSNAMNNPRDLTTDPIPGLPSDPLEARAYLMWLDSRWDRGNGKKFREQAKESFKAWVNGTDENAPWKD